MPRDPLPRLRKICLAFPAAHEVEAWGAPTFRVRNRMFASYARHHHGDPRIAVWCKATFTDQDLLVHANPDRFFVPPYVGPSGWVAVVLDAKTDWTGLRAILAEGYRLIAPKKLAALLDEG